LDGALDKVQHLDVSALQSVKAHCANATELEQHKKSALHKRNYVERPDIFCDKVHCTNATWRYPRSALKKCNLSDNA
jgi:hypothetical protein